MIFGRIRRICDKYDMWMHVDRAFQTSVLLSQKYRKELDGIEKADSLSWDACRWLFRHSDAVSFCKGSETSAGEFQRSSGISQGS